ncbi:HalOD1 output domain-containing protein [Halomicrobium salinisoli]|uniref:HalOD1 output domain-containing protein n=1 Tax=Halomicrobium salinisoli TaxID=2878391 RepID=UPI001CF0B492|nr:HalOD1 output domain-containing protein [Halomicrobium salinisoli]
MALTARTPTDRILEALADEAGVDPVELSPPLADVVDPDALDALLERADPDAEVAVHFEYQEYEVVARADGGVDVR